MLDPVDIPGLRDRGKPTSRGQVVRLAALASLGASADGHGDDDGLLVFADLGFHSSLPPRVPPVTPMSRMAARNLRASFLAP